MLQEFKFKIMKPGFRVGRNLDLVGRKVTLVRLGDCVA